MKKFYTPLATILLLSMSVACTTSPNTGLSTEPVDVAVTENVVNDKVIGTWRGIIPCADCPGINYNLTLNDDNSYEETLIYQDRSAQPFTRTGTWKLNDGTLELDDPNEEYFRFSLSDGELLMLDRTTGRPIVTQLPNMYRLRRDAGLSDTDMDTWNDSSKRGIDFVGNGNEPGWLLEIDLEKNISFKTLPTETISMTAPVPAQPTVKGNVTTYRTETKSGELVVELTKTPCTDSMSGKAYDYSVRVKANGQEFSGCGLYLAETN